MKYETKVNEIYKSIIEGKAPEADVEKITTIKSDGFRNVMAAHAKIMNEDYSADVESKLNRLIECADADDVKEYLTGMKMFAEQNGFLNEKHATALKVIEERCIFEKGDYKKNTLAFISGLLKDDKMANMKEFLQGIKKQLEATGWLSDKQQAALDKVKKNLEK